MSNQSVLVVRERTADSALILSPAEFSRSPEGKRTVTPAAVSL